MLRKAAHNNHGDDTFHIVYNHGYTPAMDRIFASAVPQSILLGECLFISFKLVMLPFLQSARIYIISSRPSTHHVPSTGTPSQYGLPLSAHPDIIVWRHTRPTRSVEEQLVAVCERDVDDGSLARELPQPVSDGDAEIVGIFCCELPETDILACQNRVQLDCISESEPWERM